MLGLLTAMDADTRDVVLSGVGLGLVSIGLVLNAAGWCWMRHLVTVRGS
jgi:hypothetical protein